MKEQAESFGTKNNLIGIYTESKKRSNIDLPVILFLNAGLLHQVGPFRMHVEIARNISMLGFSSFRFNLSGIGDSRKISATKPHEEQAIEDVRLAMDYIQNEKGKNKFVLFGLCAGADNAHFAALEDSRVAGIIFLDAYGYETRLFKIKELIPDLNKIGKIFNRDKIINFIIKAMQKLKSDTNSKSDEESIPLTAVDIFGRHWPEQKQAERDILLFLKNGLNLLYIYSGGLPGIYNYKRQFWDMFPKLKSKPNLQVVHFIKASHTYEEPIQRDKMINVVSSWLMERFVENK